MSSNRKGLVPIVVLVAILALQSSALLPPTFAAPTVRWVAPLPATAVPPGTSCSAPGYNTISLAIAAASPGDTIKVCAGTYSEQLSITKSLTLLGLGTQSNPTTIKPNSVTANAAGGGAFGPSSSPEAAIILVSGTTGVTIVNVVVDGSLASVSITSCAPPSYEGVLFSGASGTLVNSVVTNFYQSSTLYYGCQSSAGLAVLVQTPTSEASTVSISNNVVTNYQKDGIACNDAGSMCSINGNTVSPLAAATSANAPNGIQVAYGAVAKVSHNTVTGNECNSVDCGPNLITQSSAVGILTLQSGAGTVVTGNTVTGNDVGIASAQDAVKVTGNTVTNNRYVGIYQDDGTYTASYNQISGSPIGVAVVSDGFVSTPTTSTLIGNDFDGPFSTAFVQVTTFTGGPSGTYGGTNPGMARLTLNGLTETVSGGIYSAATPATCTPTTCLPTIVNITSLPKS